MPRPVAKPNPLLDEKAFANFRQGSGVSPYMQIFRNDTAGGTIDNYSTLVRPMLDQRAANQRFRSEIGGLQQSVQRQVAPGQQEVPVLQGLVSPGQFIDYRGYLPSVNQNNQMPPLGP